MNYVVIEWGTEWGRDTVCEQARGVTGQGGPWEHADRRSYPERRP